MSDNASTELTPDEVREVEKWLKLTAFPDSYYTGRATAPRKVIDILGKLCDRYWTTLQER